MSIVIHEFHIKEYTVLKLDTLPKHTYKKYKIAGEEYDPVSLYDTQNCIAIKGKGTFVGETVEFV